MFFVYEFRPNEDAQIVRIKARFARTTGEHLRWIIALCHGEDIHLYAMDYAHEFVDEISSNLTLEDIQKMGGIDGIMRVCELISTTRTLPKQFAANYALWWERIFRADKYDPARAESGCKCPHCVRDEPQTELCLFWGVDEVARLVGSYDWELARQCWDLPIEVYQMLISQNRQRILGDAAERQERDQRAETERLAKQANSPSSWAAASAARERVLEQRRRQAQDGGK